MPLVNLATNTYTTTQKYDRKAMTLLWGARDRFDNTTKSLLQYLWDNKKKGTLQCITTVVYKFPKNSNVGAAGYGRVYGSKGCLGTLQRDVRATLCHELYYDIDMVLCHPTIATQLSRNTLGVEMHYLEHYVKNRDTVTAEICEKFNVESSSVKQAVNAMLNGAKLPIEFADSPLLSGIRQECNVLIMNLMLRPEAMYQRIRAATEKRDNPRGSFISTVLQEYERKCLEALIESLTDQGFYVGVLMYDGCMVENTKEITKDVLDTASAVIKERTGYDMRLKVKDMEEEAISHDELKRHSDTDDGVEPYEVVKARWEMNHFYYSTSNTICEVTDDGLRQYDLAHAEEAFNMWLCKPDGDGKDSFLKRWRKDPTRRIVHKLVFKMPEDCAADECSLFMGFDYKRIKDTYTADEATDALALFNNILSAICDDEAAVIDYVTKTFAHILQKPFEKTGVLIAFASHIQGTGKDTIMQVIENIIGPYHTAHYQSTEAYWDKHDTKAEGAVFVYLEEACSALNKAKFNELKARITSNSISINPKGLKAYSVPNIARNFMTTNEEEPFKMEETDRRGLLIAPNGRCVNINWTSVYERLFSPKYIKAIGDYLASVDISTWMPRRIPETQVKKDMRELSKTSEDRFFDQWESDTWVDGKEMYNQYKAYCENENIPHAQNQMSFLKKAIKYKGKKYQAVRDRSTDANVYAPIGLQ